MSMLVTIVLVVGTKDCLQTNYGDVVHCCTKFLFVNCLLKSVHVNFDPGSCSERNDYVTSALQAYLRFARSATARYSQW